jgi:hypothetical protein
VYAPILGVPAAGQPDTIISPGAEQLDGRLQELLLSLQAGLGAAIRKMPDQVGGRQAASLQRCITLPEQPSLITPVHTMLWYGHVQQMITAGRMYKRSPPVVRVYQCWRYSESLTCV